MKRNWIYEFLFNCKWQKRYLNLQHFIHQYQFMLNIFAIHECIGINRQGICAIILITTFFCPLSLKWKSILNIITILYFHEAEGEGWEEGSLVSTKRRWQTVAENERERIKLKGSISEKFFFHCCRRKLAEMEKKTTTNT